MDDLVLEDTKNQAWKNDKSRFGFKMLQKMGWKEDKGLGKNDSGSVASIKVSKRAEGLGLGMEKVTDSAGATGWSSTAQSFTEVLKLLNESYGKPAKLKKSKKSKIPILSAGMKYKKHSAAKDLSTKTAAELKSIFGHSIVSTVVQSEVDEETGNSSKLVLESSLTIEKVKKPKKIPADEPENAVNGGDTEVTVEKRKKKKRSVDENVVEDLVEDAEKKVKKSKKVTAVEEAVEMISEKKSKKSKKVKE